LVQGDCVAQGSKTLALTAIVAAAVTNAEAEALDEGATPCALTWPGCESVTRTLKE
jgi:hypothetical protein